MPPRKRTSQSKHSPPTSPTTSTSHAPADQHHHLHHTGPSISTRSRVDTTSPKRASTSSQSNSSSKPAAKQDQKGPPEREQKTPPPLGARSPFVKFVYALLLVMLVMVVWYVYRMAVLLERVKEEVGWWGVIVGHDDGRVVERARGWGFGFTSRTGADRPSESDGVEGSLNRLAEALGVPPVEVASAVRPLIARASVALRAEETGRSEAMRVLLEDPMPMRGNKDGGRSAAYAGILEEDEEDVM